MWFCGMHPVACGATSPIMISPLLVVMSPLMSPAEVEV